MWKKLLLATWTWKTTLKYAVFSGVLMALALLLVLFVFAPDYHDPYGDGCCSGLRRDMREHTGFL